MTYDTSEWLVETDWLADHIHRPDVVVIDATWYMPGHDEDAYEQFCEEHIPGALFFDIDEIADQRTGLPHMLPSEKLFASAVSAMGIGNDTHVIVYDRQGIFSSPRVWWTFRVMGHDKVSVLNGGLKKWVAESRPVASGKPKEHSTGHYAANKQESMVCNFDELLGSIKTKDNSLKIIDARPEERFAGLADEPRPGLRKGRMPGAFNIQFCDIVNEDGTIKSRDVLRERFTTAGISHTDRVVTTCGSGITAAILFFALALLGNNTTALYDGSWAEWGGRPEALIIQSQPQ